MLSAQITVPLPTRDFVVTTTDEAGQVEETPYNFFHPCVSFEISNLPKWDSTTKRADRIQSEVLGTFSSSPEGLQELTGSRPYLLHHETELIVAWNQRLVVRPKEAKKLAEYATLPPAIQDLVAAEKVELVHITKENAPTLKKTRGVERQVYYDRRRSFNLHSVLWVARDEGVRGSRSFQRLNSYSRFPEIGTPDDGVKKEDREYPHNTICLYWPGGRRDGVEGTLLVIDYQLVALIEWGYLLLLNLGVFQEFLKANPPPEQWWNVRSEGKAPPGA